MKSDKDLKEKFQKINHRGYLAYKEIKGIYQFENYIFVIEHVQGDPFASPSQVKIIVNNKKTKIPNKYFDRNHRRIAVQDYLLRKLEILTLKNSFKIKGTGKSGLISVSHCGPEILERSACQICSKNGDIMIRMEIGFPANGRTINAKGLEIILFEILPEMIYTTVAYKNINKEELDNVIQLADNQFFIRNYLKNEELVAFIADGSVLPRESGISLKPLKNAVKFKTPESMKIKIDLPDGNIIYGMGIKRGVTLVVGGGYHGKTTLLESFEKGVYDHIVGDGREYVFTDRTAVKVRSEDGRSIAGIDISMFINNLPNKKDTIFFETKNASGSTSQAANIIEAIETDSKVLLIDEDTSATNFMIRDKLMQLVVTEKKEPITPYIDRIRDLYEIYGISSILVVGSSGEYFDKADSIIQMDEYRVYDITENVKELSKEYNRFEKEETNKNSLMKAMIFNRNILPYKEWCKEEIKIKVNNMDCLRINKDDIDTRYLEQLVDKEQLRAIGYIIVYINKHIFENNNSLQNLINKAYKELEDNGFDTILDNKFIPCNLAMPRKQEIFMCMNRFRNIRVIKQTLSI